MRISIRDCQSWKDLDISLINGQANVAIADNNYGKSVPIKALQFALLGNYLGRNTAKGHIRKRALYSTIHVDFEDNKREFFCLMRHTGSHLYKIKNFETDTWEQYEGSCAPPEVISYLNWHINTKYGIISSIVDLDNGLPFVSSTPRYNAEYIAPLLANPELEAKADNIAQGLKDVSNQISFAKSHLDSYTNSLSNTPLLDEQQLRDSIDKHTHIISLANSLIPLMTAFENHHTLQCALLTEQSRPKTHSDLLLSVLQLTKAYEDIQQVHCDMTVSLPTLMCMEAFLSIADKRGYVDSLQERMQLIDKYVTRYTAELAVITKVAKATDVTLKARASVNDATARLFALQEYIDELSSQMAAEALAENKTTCPNCGFLIEEVDTDEASRPARLG